MTGRRTGLPVHPVPPTAASPLTLAVRGLVARQLDLGKGDIARLPHREVEADFSCEEGWTAPGLRWRGVALRTLVELAQPLPEARFVQIGAGVYEVTIALDAAEDVLLCDRLDGKPLSRVHGAPWRLLVPGETCFTSVKWVDRLEVTSSPGEPVGERIALSRLRSSLSPSGHGRVAS